MRVAKWLRALRPWRVVRCSECAPWIFGFAWYRGEICGFINGVPDRRRVLLPIPFNLVAGLCRRLWEPLRRGPWWMVTYHERLEMSQLACQLAEARATRQVLQIAELQHRLHKAEAALVLARVRQVRMN